jgi:hypothetical protein
MISGDLAPQDSIKFADLASGNHHQRNQSAFPAKKQGNQSNTMLFADYVKSYHKQAGVGSSKEENKEKQQQYENPFYLTATN